MRLMGFEDAVRTPTGPDAGIDVLSRRAVGQVKAHMNPIGAPTADSQFDSQTGNTSRIGRDSSGRFLTQSNETWAVGTSAGELLITRFGVRVPGGVPRPC